MLSDEQVDRLMLAVRKHLISVRRSAKLSQKALERVSGVDQPTISRIEAGEAIPELPTISKLVDGVGLRLSQFFAQIEGSQSSSLTAAAPPAQSESLAGARDSIPPHGDQLSTGALSAGELERIGLAIARAARAQAGAKTPDPRGVRAERPPVHRKHRRRGPR